MNTPNEEIEIPLASPEESSAYRSGLVGAPVTATELGSDEVDPNNPPWNVLVALGVWVLSIVLINFLPLLVVGPYLILRYKGASLPDPIYADHTATLLLVMAFIPAHLLTFGAIWLLVSKFGKRPFWHTFGWGWGRRFGLWSSAGLALLLFLAGGLLAKLIGGDQPTDIDLIVNTSTAVRITLALLAATTGPVVEELVYRGVLYSALQRPLGTAGAVALVSFLFTLVHVFQYKNNLGVIAVILMLSVTLTLVRAWTGRLLPCIVMHMVFNGVQSIIIVFHPYLQQFEQGVEQKTGLLLPLVWPVLQTVG